MAQPVFSVIIPVYNEEKRLPKNIGQITNFFGNVGAPVELILVNDGSTDGTAGLLADYEKKYGLRVLSYAQNRGKGYAVRTGALAAQGEWILFFDIDLATPLKMFNDFVAALPGNQADIIIGSRRTAGAMIKRCESKLRIFLGKGFTRLSNLLVPNVTDFTCGFKGFSRQAVQTIFPRARINRWGFDTELLYIGTIHRLKIRELPVQWTHDTDSRVKVWRSVVSSLGELLQMFINRCRGYYR